MKRLLFALMVFGAMFITACGGKKTQGESGDTESNSITSLRQPYRFAHPFIEVDVTN